MCGYCATPLGLNSIVPSAPRVRVPTLGSRALMRIQPQRGCTRRLGEEMCGYCATPLGLNSILSSVPRVGVPTLGFGVQLLRSYRRGLASVPADGLSACNRLESVITRLS